MPKQQQPLSTADPYGSESWEQIGLLQCEVTLEIPVPGFTVRDLLKLESGEIMNTRWAQGTDLPLRINGELVGWGEFEVVANKLGLRVTELA